MLTFWLPRSRRWIVIAGCGLLLATWMATARGWELQQGQAGTGIQVTRLSTPYQQGETAVRVLLPDHYRPQRRYRCLYVLPVEAHDEHRYGDGLEECRRADIPNRFQLICVAPAFSQLPWYADHPTDPQVRQEMYITHSVIPWVEAHYSVVREPAGRLLVGFSKSGWGAFSLLLRHPALFGKAAAWDAPLMMQHPDKYGMQPIFGTQANFERYRISGLLRDAKPDVKEHVRLIHLGYGNFREHHQQLERLLNELGIPHMYRDGPERKHNWHSGWLIEAVELLAAPAHDR